MLIIEGTFTLKFTKIMQKIELSLEEFKQLSCAQISSLETIVSGLNFNPIELTGEIIGLNKSRNNAKSRTSNKEKLYSLSLKDGSTIVEANSEMNIFKDINENSQIRVICFCQFALGYNNESIKIIANIIHAIPVDKKRVIPEIDHTALTLKKLKNSFHHFPSFKNPNVSIIYSNASEATVNVDFYDALSPQQQYFIINEIPINLSQPNLLADTIKSIKTDILVIIRGGGDENAMSSFDQPEVLEAFAACKAYRIVGIGHAINHNLINLLADYSAITPTAAGTHLKEKQIETFKLNSKMYQLNKVVDDQKQQISELNNKLKANKIQTDSLNEYLLNLSTQQKEMIEMSSMQNNKFEKILKIACAFIIILFIAFYFLSHKSFTG